MARLGKASNGTGAVNTAVPVVPFCWTIINYHPQSGWFEDAPLKQRSFVAG